MQRENTDVKEKAGKKVKKKLLNNIGLKLVSILIAIILWFTVVIINNPKDTRTFANIPVKLINTELLEKEGKVYEVIENSGTVRVTVEVPKNDLNLLRSSDIIAEADVANLTAVNTVPISCRVQNDDVNVVSISVNPEVVRLELEDEISKWVNVTYTIKGEPAEGYMVSKVTQDSTRIQVTGPKSVVDQIDHALLDVDVKNTISNQSVSVEPVYYDAEGSIVDMSRVKPSTDKIHVDLTILAVKEVPIELNVKGTPADGYLETGVVEYEPQTVRICGTAAAIGSINQISIPEDELDITGATRTVQNTINLRKYLPENVSLADSGFNGRVTASVYIEAVRTRTLTVPKSNVEVQGMPDEVEWEYADGMAPLEVRISGLNARISPVDQNTIKGTANIGEWMQRENIEQLEPGTYRIPVDVTLPGGIQMESQPYIRINVIEREMEEEE